MPSLTQIELPSGSVYDLHDSRVDSLNNWEYVISVDAATTPYGIKWTPAGGSEITGTLVASANTMYKIYLVPADDGSGTDQYVEYITVRTGTDPSYTYSWEMLGTITTPDLTNYIQQKDASHYGDVAGELAYKDSASGSVSVPATFTTSVSATTSSANITGTGVRLETDNEVMTAASFSGESMTSTGNFTPVGTIGVGSGAANYTPAGSVSVSSAGSTDSIYKHTSQTIVTDMSVAAPSATAATGELVYCEVTGTKLTLKKFVETTDTGSSITVKTGDASYSFAGTGAELTFTGTQGSVSVSGTTAGSITPTKSKTTVSPASSGAVTYTPAGTVAVPDTFTASTTVATTSSETVTVS